MAVRRLALLALFAAFLSSCGDDSVCDPGATQPCTCPGGASGAQVCAVSGEGWGSCDCGSPDAGRDDGSVEMDAGSRPDATADASGADAGSDAGPPDECAFVACGGDPTGTWDFVAVCRMEWTPPCADIVVTGETFAWPQTLDLRGDGSYIWERMSVMQTRSYTVPASCIDPGTTSCTDYASSSGITTGVTTCTGDVAVECMCEWRRLGSMTATQTGTWSRAANLITLVPGAGMTYRLQYCVNGDWLQVLSEEAPPMVTEGEHTFARR